MTQQAEKIVLNALNGRKPKGNEIDALEKVANTYEDKLTLIRQSINDLIALYNTNPSTVVMRDALQLLNETAASELGIV